MKFLLILCVCFVLTGCNNDYAQKEYDAVDKIVKEEDRYVKSDSSFSNTGDEGNVNTIVECTPDNTTNGYITQTVSLKSGLNRIKIVGVGCKDIKLELLSPDL